MNKLVKKITKFVVVVLVLSMMCTTAFADTLPYVTYNYDYWKDVTYTPAAYVPDGSISAASLGIEGEFGNIYDLHVSEDLGIIALCDTPKNKIYIIDNKDYSLITIIEEFFNNEKGEMDTFNKPQGVCISPNGQLYVCDTENMRVVYFDISKNYEFTYKGRLDNTMLDSDILRQSAKSASAGVNKKPASSDDSSKDDDKNKTDDNASDSEDADESDETDEADKSDEDSDKTEEGSKEEKPKTGDEYAFYPTRICVDDADLLYIINRGEFQGILQLERNGKFNGFFGTIKVNISLWDKIWKTLSTSAQKAKSTLYIPTEYTGIDIDEDNFLYASYLDTSGTQAVMRLNSKGQDVIRKGANANVAGDVMEVSVAVNKYSGYNKIQDVVYCGSGIYSILDNLRGRIFTYDAEGNLLYIYGGLGSQDGTMNSASAIESNGEDRIVCDYKKNEIFIFKPTKYGNLINEAVACRFDGDEKLAVEKWNEVLKLNENFEQAYIGIGKSYLNSGEYKKAMDNLSLGMSRSYYSKAYKRYRNNVIKDNFNLIFGSILVLIVGFIGYRTYKKRKNRVDDDDF